MVICLIDDVNYHPSVSGPHSTINEINVEKGGAAISTTRLLDWIQGFERNFLVTG